MFPSSSQSKTILASRIVTKSLLQWQEDIVPLGVWTLMLTRVSQISRQLVCMQIPICSLAGVKMPLLKLMIWLRIFLETYTRLSGLTWRQIQALGARGVITIPPPIASSYYKLSMQSKLKAKRQEFTLLDTCGIPSLAVLMLAPKPQLAFLYGTLTMTMSRAFPTLLLSEGGKVLILSNI